MGHAAGDTVLAAYGSRLTAWAGPRAAVGRLGGDEFALVLNADRRERRLGQLVRMLHTPVVLDDGRTVDVAASVSSGQRSGVLKPGGLNIRIKDFVSWVNREVATHNPASQLIPDDPHGPSSPAAYEGPWPGTSPAAPGGPVALAIQYGHMSTVLDARASSPYGARSRGGIHTVLDVEPALAAADTAARLQDRLAAGERLSGPAARRALTAAAHIPRFEGRIVPRTFVHKARAYLARDGIVLYDSPEALLICAFKHDVAMCEPDPSATAPRQYNCRPGCANTVRTDGHALLLRQRAGELDQLASHLPPPLARRLRTNAARLRVTADTHDSTAQTAEIHALRQRITRLTLAAAVLTHDQDQPEPALKDISNILQLRPPT